MARVFACQAFFTFLLGGVGVAHGLSRQFSLKAELSPSLAFADGPPAEQDVMDVLANINTSLLAVQDIVDTANSTAHSLGGDVLQSIVDFQGILDTLATAKNAGKKPSLTKEAASRATRLVDTVQGSAENAESNLSTALDAFSSNVSAVLPPVLALAHQATSQFLEALTMVEDIYNVSQSKDSLSTRQVAKQAARKAVRELKATQADAGAVVDIENETAQQVNTLRRFVDRFGFEAAKKMLRRAISKLHGNKPGSSTEEDVKDEESPKTASTMADTSDDVTAEEEDKDKESTADTVVAWVPHDSSDARHSEEDVKDKEIPTATNKSSDEVTSEASVQDKASQKATSDIVDSDLASDVTKSQGGSHFSILDPNDGSVQSDMSEEELQAKFSPEEIKELLDRGLIRKSVQSESDGDSSDNAQAGSDTAEGKWFYNKETGAWISDSDLRNMFNAESIKELLDRGIIEAKGKQTKTLQLEAKRDSTRSSSMLSAAMKRIADKLRNEAVRKSQFAAPLAKAVDALMMTPSGGAVQILRETANPVASIKQVFDDQLAPESSKTAESGPARYFIKEEGEGASAEHVVTEEELKKTFSPEEISAMTDRGVIQKWSKSNRTSVDQWILSVAKAKTASPDSASAVGGESTSHPDGVVDVEGIRYFVTLTSRDSPAQWIPATVLHKKFTSDEIKEMFATGLLDQYSRDVSETGQTSPVGNLIAERGSPLSSIKEAMDSSLNSDQTNELTDTDKYFINEGAEGSTPKAVSAEELSNRFSLDEINDMAIRGVIERWTKPVTKSDDAKNDRALLNDAHPDEGLAHQDGSHEARYFLAAVGQKPSMEWISDAVLRNTFTAQEITEMFDTGMLEQYTKAGTNQAASSEQLDMDTEKEPKKTIVDKKEARSLMERHVFPDLDVELPEDVEEALLKKGPLDVHRTDACALATQKIFHANKTLHRLSRKYNGVKSTLHRMVASSVGAGNAAIDSITSTVYPSLAELPGKLARPVAKGLKSLKHTKIPIKSFAQDKSVILEAVSTLGKTAPLAETLQAAVDEACLSGACGETAQKACEAHKV